MRLKLEAFMLISDNNDDIDIGCLFVACSNMRAARDVKGPV